MRRVLLACIAAAGVAACSPESSLPEATGKGSIRAINAIPTSPEIGFLIEERTLAGVNYQEATAPENWDDLVYTFNFEARLRPGDPGVTRVASQEVDVFADTAYTFLISGDIEAPTITVWEIAERDFSGSGTVFEVRVGHAADVLGRIDVYVALDGVAPALGEQTATLSPGDVSTAVDMEQDEYVVTVTTAGDPADVLFQSEPTQINAQQSALFTIFEGDANDTAPVNVTIFNSLGGSSSLPDARFFPTVRFIHATMELATADIYDDEMLQDLLVADHAFGDATGDIETAIGEVPITYTAAGNPGAILFDTTYTAFAGTRTNFYMTFVDDELLGSRIIVDRRSIETLARLTFFHSAFNHQRVDFYVVDANEPIDDALPRLADLSYGSQTPSVALDAGSFDLYVTVPGEKTVLDGPIRVDLALGDVIEGVLIDRVDPTLAELMILPPP